MKCKEWFEVWLENYVKPTAKNRTYTKYADIYRIRIATAFGEMQVEELTPLALQQFVTGLLQHGNLKTHEGLSVNTVNSTINVIRNAFQMAFTAGIVQECVSDSIKRPKSRERKIESFSVAEQRKIERRVGCMPKSKYKGITLCLYTGLRIGELLALTWCDVDFAKKLLFVNKSCYDGRDDAGNFVRLTGETKTETSNRVIPLSPKMVNMLRTMKKKAKSQYIIESETCPEKPLSVRSYQMSFELLLKRLGISHKGFHALRHTFATRAVESGMDVKTLSEILGHRNPSVTLRRYVHSMIEHKRDAIDKLCKMMETK